MMLGTFWLAQQTLLDVPARRSDAELADLGYLITATLLPFSASLLAEFVTVRLVGRRRVLAEHCAARPRVGEQQQASPSWWAAQSRRRPARGRLRIFRRRILVAQIGYAITALLCLINTYLSVGALTMVQAYFISAPPLPFLDRLLLNRPMLAAAIRLRVRTDRDAPAHLRYTSGSTGRSCCETPLPSDCGASPSLSGV